MSRTTKFLAVAAVFSLAAFSTGTLVGYHSYARYFNFFERPEDYLYQPGSFIDASAFYTHADAGFRSNGGGSSILELSGPYELRDMIQATSYVLPDVAKAAKETLKESVFRSPAPLRFKPRAVIRSTGLGLRYAYGFSNHLTVGAWLPVMRASGTGKYDFYQHDFWSKFPVPPEEINRYKVIDRIDVARRQIHEALGFSENYWSEVGFGDLDLYLRYNRCLDHRFLMRSIDMGFQLGVVVPTGIKIRNNNPLALPFMGDGHWTIYGDLALQCELKQDWKVGGVISGAYHFNETRERRVSVYREPSAFSPLVARIEVEPGQSAKFSAYIIRENIADGLHAQARYTYTRHARDRWFDVRTERAVDSYLSRTPSEASDFGGAATQQAIKDNIFYKENLSKFRSHYITMQLTYNTADAQLKWKLRPNFYAMYDMPLQGRAMCKTHHFSLGAELHF